MFDYAYKRMEEAYDVYRGNVLREFVLISTFAFDKVKQHFDLLLANLSKKTKKSTRSDSARDKEEVDDSVALKQNVARLALEWETMWRFPGEVEDMSSDSLELPLEFVRRSNDLEDTEEDNDEGDEEDDSEDEDAEMDEEEEEDEE